MQVLLFGVLGLATGSLYGVVALGVVLSYRASGVVNFSAGAVGAVGAFVTYNLRDGSLHVPWILAVFLGLLSGAIFGGITQVLVMRVLRNASNLSKVVATLGILSIAQGLIIVIWPSSQNAQQPVIPNSILPSGSQNLIHLFGVQGLPITADRLIIIGIVAILTVALWLVYSKTTFGLATAAVAENAPAAGAGGLSVNAIELTNFIIAGVLAAGAAILLAPIIGLTASTLSLIIIPAVAAAMFGKFASFGLTILGAAVIGVGQDEIERFITNPNLIGLANAVPLFIIIAVAIAGGQARLSRGDIVARLPLPGAGRIGVGRAVLGVAIMLVVCSVVSATWALALSALLGAAVVLISLVVVTGFGGQLSLGQAALAGFGAWASARLYLVGVPLVLAIVLGMVLTIPVGLAIALPALRIRGYTLAIATLALGDLIATFVLSSPSLTGGFIGLSVQNESFLGFNVDPVLHPQRYAVFTLLGFVVAAVLAANVRRGRSGRRLLAVRGNERAASALGVGVYGAKLYAFGLASAIAALGGILIAFQQNFLNLGQFNVLTSITYVEYAVIGGIGWIAGSFFGALNAPGAPISQLFSSVLNLPNWILPIAGLGTIVVLVQAPNGVAALNYFELRRRPKAIMYRFLNAVDSLASSRHNREDVPSEPPRLPRSFEIEVQNLSVRFGGVVALDDVSFKIHPGEVLGVIGPNGAGKTTLLDTITGFTKQSTGTVLLDGDAIDSWSPERRARAGIGRSWQSVELFDGISVRDNLLVAADNQSKRRYFTDLYHPGRTPRSDVVDRVVAALDLEGELDALPSELPQGRARLVGLARAMVAEPIILLLDEPAAGLDTHEAEELGTVIRMLAERLGMGVVVIEHDVPLVTSVCDRIVCLDFGHQIAVGTPAEILQNEEVIESYLGASPVGESSEQRRAGVVST
jgi:ABC-type branched-subunit amino acid transport system ATPase component/ABC-type branched-subunit amino acid transport system permease subunit